MHTQLAQVEPCEMDAGNLLLELLVKQFEADELLQLLGENAASLGAEYWARALHTPLADFLRRPSKEFRANLVVSAYAMAGGVGSCPAALSKLVEIIHAGSLIVDDIQDQSESRRGAPSLHVVYGMPVALNAGNWLYFWAFSMISRLGLSPERQLEVFKALSRTVFACHYGQGLDLTARVTELPQAQLSSVVETSTRLKTGALMAFAARLGAVAASAPESVVEALTKFGSQLGIGLQMLDDVGGLLNEKRWVKGAEDLRLARPTWPWAWLAEELQPSKYSELRALAVDVSEGRTRPELLALQMRRELRGIGRIRVRRHLQQAFSELGATFGPSETLDAIEHETQRLEKSYG
jgi:geranylgeranyl pyrophosphate synthase